MCYIAVINIPLKLIPYMREHSACIVWCFLQTHTARNTMRSVTLLLFALGVVFATAADMQTSWSANADVIQLLFATEAQARVTRQDPNTCSEQGQEVLNNLPMECSSLNSSTSLDNPEEIASYFGTFCIPECGNPIILLLQRCLDECHS